MNLLDRPERAGDLFRELAGSRLGFFAPGTGKRNRADKGGNKDGLHGVVGGSEIRIRTRW